MTLKKFDFKPAESSRPGVALREADFNQHGEGRVPFSGGQFTVEPGATSRPDTHQVSECWMVAQGKGTLSYDGQEHIVEKGDYLFFEPQKTHFIHNNFDELIIIYTVWWLEK